MAEALTGANTKLGEGTGQTDLATGECETGVKVQEILKEALRHLFCLYLGSLHSVWNLPKLKV